MSFVGLHAERVETAPGTWLTRFRNAYNASGPWSNPTKNFNSWTRHLLISILDAKRFSSLSLLILHAVKAKVRYVHHPGCVTRGPFMRKAMRYIRNRLLGIGLQNGLVSNLSRCTFVPSRW